MSKGIGRLIQIGIARETTRGTSPASATYWIPHNEFDIFEKDTKITDEQTRGVIEDSVGQSIVKKWAEGGLKAPIGDRHFPLLLYGIFGTLASSVKSGETLVYDHNISVQQGAQHQSLSLYIDDPLGGQDYAHALAVLASLEIAYEQGKFVDYAANFKSKKGATATLTPSTTAENRFLPQHLTFKLASTQAGLDAAGATVIKSLSLKIEQNIEDDDVLGNSAPADFLNKQFAIEGTLEAIWQNETDFKNAALAGTAQAMRIDLVNSDVTIGTASNPRVKIDLHSVVFKEITRPVRINELVKQTVSFKAHYNTTDSKMASVLCNNLVSSY
ncbi:hypothetical protein HYT04_01350 [Candidatus Kaiserbacteria bacterium]|nr:hypothetical protein [Candidatus Kaiserbacteria bacterium]